jgi:hypothetical protein
VYIYLSPKASFRTEAFLAFLHTFSNSSSTYITNAFLIVSNSLFSSNISFDGSDVLN